MIQVGEDGMVYVYVPFLGEYLSAVYKYSVAVASVVAMLVLIVSGIQWMSPGNVVISVLTKAGGEKQEESVNNAKKRIAGAFTGLILALGSYVILFTINPDLVEFKYLKVPYIKGEPVPTIDLFEDEVVAPIADTSPITDISITARGSNEVPLFYQFSSPWGGRVYGPEGKRACECGSSSNPGPDRSLCDASTDECCTNMTQSACGPTSLAMILAFYGADVNPYSVAQFAGREGNGRTCNRGTNIGTTIGKLDESSWSSFTGDRVSKEEAINLLNSDIPIIFLCRGCSATTKDGSTRTWGGHYMVLTDVDASGTNFFLNDPGAQRDSKEGHIISSSQLDDNGGFWHVRPR